MRMLLQDLRIGLRMLRRSPGFTLAAVTTLAVGIAACSVVFGTAYGALLRPLPFARAERLVSIEASYPPLDTWFRSHTSYPNYVDFRRDCGGIEDLAAYRIEHPHFTGGPRPARLTAILGTANVFGLMGMSPMLGRVFSEQEDRPGGDPVVVLGERFWRSQLGGAPDVVGRPLTLGQGSYTIVGVIPERFDRGWFDADIWLPLTSQTDLNEQRYGNRICLVGRRRSDVSPTQIAAELNTVEKRLENDYPTEVPEAVLRAVPLREAQLGADRIMAMTVLSVGVGFVLRPAGESSSAASSAHGSRRRRSVAASARVRAGARPRAASSR